MHKYFVAIIVVIIAALAFVQPASAASVYDNSIIVADKLYVGTASNKQDVTGNWAGLLQSSSGTASCFDSYFDAVSSGTYAVIQYGIKIPSDAEIKYLVKVVWVEVPDWTATFEPSDYGLYLDYHSTYKSMFLSYDGSNFVGDCNYMNTKIAVPDYNSGTGYEEIYHPFISTFDVEYPSGYEGEIIPDTANVIPKDKLQYGWAVDNAGVVTATYSQNLDLDVLQHCGITWTLRESDEFWAAGTVINTVTQPEFKTYKYSSITAGFYQLTAQVNYCVPFIDDGSVHPNTANISYDGSFVGGVTNKGGADSNNIFNVSSTLLNSFGFTQAIQAPVTAIKSLTDSECSPITVPLFFGKSMTWPCLSQFYGNIPALFTMWQVSITGIVGYWFSVKMLDHIKSLLNPNNDEIDVVDL